MNLTMLRRNFPKFVGTLPVIGSLVPRVAEAIAEQPKVTHILYKFRVPESWVDDVWTRASHAMWSKYNTFDTNELRETPEYKNFASILDARIPNEFQMTDCHVFPATDAEDVYHVKVAGVITSENIDNSSDNKYGIPLDKALSGDVVLGDVELSDKPFELYRAQ